MESIKNGIIIDGKVYELEMTDKKFGCDDCDLFDRCRVEKDLSDAPCDFIEQDIKNRFKLRDNETEKEVG